LYYFSLYPKKKAKQQHNEKYNIKRPTKLKDNK